MEFKLGWMVLNMKVNGPIIELVGLENSTILTVISTKGNLRKIKQMGRVVTKGTMDGNTLGNGRTICSMVLGKNFCLISLAMKGIFLMAKL